jgi:DNA mismatch endonuclease (patch repair protein)
MDVLNQEQRKRNMQANKSKGTLPEILLAKNLWRHGYRYRKNLSTVVGKPDIAFPKYKVAVFIDGEFWHGKDWDKKRKPSLPTANTGFRKLNAIWQGMQK